MRSRRAVEKPWLAELPTLLMRRMELLLPQIAAGVRLITNINPQAAIDAKRRSLKAAVTRATMR